MEWEKRRAPVVQFGSCRTWGKCRDEDGGGIWSLSKGPLLGTSTGHGTALQTPAPIWCHPPKSHQKRLVTRQLRLVPSVGPGKAPHEGVSVGKGSTPITVVNSAQEGKGNSNCQGTCGKYLPWKASPARQCGAMVCLWGPGWRRCGAPTAFRLEVGDTMHDDVVEEERFVVHLDAARKEPTEVMDVPGGQTGSSGAGPTAKHSPYPQLPWP